MTIQQSPLLILGVILFGNLLSGVVGYACGRARPRGPTRVVETYTPKHAADIPGWEDAPR